MLVRVVLLAALAASAYGEAHGAKGYLASLPNEAALKNTVLKTYQFPKTALVSSTPPAAPREHADPAARRVSHMKLAMICLNFVCDAGGRGRNE